MEMHTKQAQNYFFLLLVSFSILSCEYESLETSVDCSQNSIILSVLDVVNTECGLENGSFTVVATGLEEGWEYSINGDVFSTNANFSNLSAGNYSVIAKSIQTQCQSEPLEVLIENEGGLQLSIVQKSDSECGETEGSIIVNQQNGIPPVEYKINNELFQPDSSFKNLPNGVYNIFAKDANGCETSIRGITISSGISLNADIQPIIIANCAVSGCHNGSQSPNLSTKENIIAEAAFIQNRTSNRSMPPAGRPDLSQEEIDKITCWLNEGAPDN
ncbi:hypothetical protein GCM10011506_19370 [Marivirga lumbricoides]|uniref:Cytochrome c domain-containing protein n=1 Tax=Marivirga lumbricoides TaxID=1046115 RepID=A0ABQ1M3B2_9BACT|nr:hypothetical protein GCM10011506_19370 [Marivirga lumbricoides]